MNEPDVTYEGGLDDLIHRSRLRKFTFEGTDDWLAWLDQTLDDLEPLKAEVIVPTRLKFKDRTMNSKVQRTAQELEGESGFLHAYAVLIATLRRDDPPKLAVDLFHRLWVEERDWFMANLSTRWLISSAVTFRDVGRTANLRLTGTVLALFFDMMKLYETERLFAPARPTVPFDNGPPKNARLPMEMDAFAIRDGDLERNMMVYVWSICRDSDPLINPIAMELMERMNKDPHTLFRRFRKMRRLKNAADADKKRLNPQSAPPQD